MKLVDELLDIENIPFRSSVCLRSVHLKDIVELAVQVVRPIADARRIVIESSIVDLDVLADADRLTQIFVNLLSNAVKFSPEGGTVQFLAESNATEIDIRVIDQGRGIPEAAQKKIFEPFEQVDKSDATKKNGIGLGLFIVKSLVEEHSGVIGVKSSEGQGATFWIKLPLLAVDRD